MCKIDTHEDHLIVKFEDGFDYPMVQTIIRHLTMLRQYPFTNDLWHIGKQRADIRLGELETMVREFHCLCPTDATRTKTAIVVDEGLTGAILELFVNALQKRVAFDTLDPEKRTITRGSNHEKNMVHAMWSPRPVNNRPFNNRPTVNCR